MFCFTARRFENKDFDPALAHRDVFILNSSFLFNCNCRAPPGGATGSLFCSVICAVAHAFPPRGAQDSVAIQFVAPAMPVVPAWESSRLISSTHGSFAMAAASLGTASTMRSWIASSDSRTREPVRATSEAH